ncbi:MAG: sugar MFS transporter, partial [Flavobacteriales bacterium]|nr:sugar MFS transporter [Flavobacteriales bacterium]
LTYAQSSFVQLAWFLAYLLLSIPAGMLITKIGYKKGLIWGLGVAGLGCMLFYPAAESRIYFVFLLALFVVAGGITIIQVSANPYVTALGSPEKASARLNLAQAFNSVGTTIAPILGAAYLLSDNIKSSTEIGDLTSAEKLEYFALESSAVQGPFLVLGAALVGLLLIVMVIKLPKILGEKKYKLDPNAIDTGQNSTTNLSIGSQFMVAFKIRSVKLGMIGIFLYVGAEVAIGSFLVNYFLEMDLSDIIRNSDTLSGIAGFMSNTFSGKALGDVDDKAVVGTFVAFYWGSAMIGRFLGSFLTSIIKPGKVLTIAGIGAIVFALITISTTGLTSMWSALIIGFFNATMFPTIFSMAVNGTGNSKAQASGLLCTAIFGGAVIPILFSSIADFQGFKVALILPVICYVYIAFFSKMLGKSQSLK